MSGASQAISSLTNFCITLYLIRVMEKEQFGLYGLGFGIVLMLASTMTASISVQFVVNLPDQPHGQRACYAMHHAAAIALVGAVLTGVAVMVSLVLSSWPVPGGTIAKQLALPVASAAAIYGLRDLLMRVAFSERDEMLVLRSNVAVGLVVLCALFSAVQVGIELNAGIALYIYSAGQLAGGLVGLSRRGLPWREFRLRQMQQAFSDSWQGGRWSVLTSLIYNLRTQVHNFVVPPLLGVAALADINAARVLVTPAVMAIPPFTQVLMPRLAEQRSRGVSTLVRTAKMAIVGLSIVAFLYSTMLMLSLSWLLPLVLGEPYRHVGGLVLAWCVVTVFLALRNGLSITLQVLRAFRGLMFANLVAAMLAVVAAILLVEPLGARGVVGALGLAELLLCLVLVMMIRIRMRAEIAGKSAAGQ
ncbi:MAG: hypothetical protein V5B33_04830 [Candidatus Accumulibacter sp. UW20]|jgi:O-antigen/teichoic acid export membrane protein